MNPLGMSMTCSHRENPTVEEQILLYGRLGFDSFFLSSGITCEYEKIPLWAKIGRDAGILLEAVHAPADGVDNLWLTNEAAARAYVERIQKITDLCNMAGVGSWSCIRPTIVSCRFRRSD